MRFVPLDDSRRLRAMRARPNVEMHVGSRDAEFLEEHLVHRRVVVLTGVHDPDVHTTVCAQSLDDGRELHEVGPGPSDQVENRVHSPPLMCATSPPALSSTRRSPLTAVLTAVQMRTRSRAVTSGWVGSVTSDCATRSALGNLVSRSRP